jgi:hypothetical protein
VPRRPQRSLEQVTGPLDALARSSSSLVALEAPSFEIAGRRYVLPRYMFLGPDGGSDPIRVGLFAGIHGDEPAGPFALVRLAQWLEKEPEIARGYCLFLYPVCNPSGFEANTRANQRGRDLNREFWRGSSEPEVVALEAELRARRFDGIVSLHADNTSNGVYGYAHGAVMTQHLLRPALAAASEFLPLNRDPIIDGFRARDGIIRDGFEGVLHAPPGVRPRPFEVILETPEHAPQFLQEAALTVALRSILASYRSVISYAQNI